MRLLLDTHAFVWWVQSPQSLSAAADSACRDPANQVYLSVASIWELQIKAQIGKIQLVRPLAGQVAYEQRANGFRLLAIEAPHVYTLDQMSLHHRDPFDRMLAAQAITEGMTLVTKDPLFLPYGVRLLW